MRRPKVLVIDDASPLDIEELLARVDLVRRLVRRRATVIHLTPTEYWLLEAMTTNQGKLLTHQWLLRKVWGLGYGSESHHLDVYASSCARRSATTLPCSASS